jgi:hypothetical protein
VRRSIPWVLILLLCVAIPARATTGPATWIIVSDLHFDPFGDASTVDRLAAAPVEQWTAILSEAHPPMSGYGGDTTYPLLESALAAMHASSPAPTVVLVAGDFLAHDYKGRFDAAAHDHSQAAYESFVDKTVAFLARRFRGAFPEAQVIPAVGNNDGYCSDYGLAPGSPFFAHMASAWEPLVNRQRAAPDFAKSFAAMGHYVATLPGTSTRVVVVNSVYWSRKFNDSCVTAGDHPAEEELKWLTSTLKASTPGGTVLLMHIPPGIDSFSASKGKEPGGFFAPKYLDAIASLLQQPSDASAVLIAGHTHDLGLRATPGNVPMLLAPSISPIFKNNPAFVTATVDPATARVTDFTVHALDLSSAKGNDAPPASAWRDGYVFSADGVGPLTADAVRKLEQKIATDPVVRQRFETGYVSGSPTATVTEKNWRAFFCAMDNLTVAPFVACLSAH